MDGSVNKRCLTPILHAIWKDVTKEDVARYSPILAGRLSAQASRGIAAVVDEIKAAVGAGNRMASFSAASAIKAKFFSLDAERAHHERANVLRTTPEGIPLVSASAARLIEKLEELLRELQSGMSRVKITFSSKRDSISVNVERRIELFVKLEIPYSNCVLKTSVHVGIYDPRVQWVSEEETPPFFRRYYQLDFAPGDEVLWKGDAGHRFSAEQLAVEILSLFHDELKHEQIRFQQGGY